MAEEQVLCVSWSDIAFNLLNDSPTGFIGADTLPLGRLVRHITRQDGHWIFRSPYAYLPRAECENDPDWHQLVTYCVINSRGFVLSYERGRAGGETRLRSRRSIGVGGHVNARDTDGCLSVDSLYRAAAREVHEEFRFPCGGPRFQYAGLINDPSDDVGRFHLGLVFEAFTDEREAASWTEECMSSTFIKPTMIGAAAREEYEGWSRILLGAMASGNVKFP